MNVKPFRSFWRKNLERLSASLKKENGPLQLFYVVLEVEAIAKKCLKHKPLIIGHR